LGESQDPELFDQMGDMASGWFDTAKGKEDAGGMREEGEEGTPAKGEAISLGDVFSTDSSM
jgi:hypothetical protein